MEEFTKEQRNQVYRLSSAIYNKELRYNRMNEFNTIGMCAALMTVIDELYDIRIEREIGLGFNYYELGVYFPEFAAMKPKNKDWGTYWWSIDSRLKTRQLKFESLIKQTS